MLWNLNPKAISCTHGVVNKITGHYISCETDEILILLIDYSGDIPRVCDRGRQQETEYSPPPLLMTCGNHIVGNVTIHQTHETVVMLNWIRLFKAYLVLLPFRPSCSSAYMLNIMTVANDVYNCTVVPPDNNCSATYVLAVIELSSFAFCKFSKSHIQAFLHSIFSSSSCVANAKLGEII